MTTTSTTPLAPVSWGELIDKITILEIKSVEIADAAAHANVLKELRMLQDIAGAHAASDEIARLKRDLKEVNGALWKIEDAIRDKERRREFDPEFIELARSVYRQNDARAALKRRINAALSSGIVEEKSYQPY
jgi:hypothetical protein